MHKTLTLLLCGVALSALAVNPVRQSFKPHAIHRVSDRSDRSDQSDLFYLRPTEEEFNRCKVIDANGDGQTIEYYYTVSAAGPVFDWPIYYVKGTSGKDADEWFITEGFEITDADQLYQLSIDARAGATGVSESFQLCIGSEPTVEAMSVVIDQPMVVPTDFTTYTGALSVPEPGTYYIGVHVNSPASAWRIMLRDIRVTTSSATAMAPAAPTAITATPDPKGLMQATVEFDFPATAMNGSALPEDEVISVKVASPAEEKTLEGKAGEHASVTLACESGENLITLTPSTSGGTGAEARVTVRVGYDIPANPVVTTTTSNDNYTLTLTWPPVTKGIQNGLIDPAEITYNVYQYVYQDEYYGWVAAAEGLTQCTFTYKATSDTQSLYEFIVTAKNSAGESEGDIHSLGNDRLGALYTLPYTDDYTTGGISHSGYLLGSPEAEEEVQWALQSAETVVEGTGTDAALIGASSTTESTTGHLSLPKIKGNGVSNVILATDAFICPSTPDVKFLMVGSDGSRTEIGSLQASSESGWQDLTFAIPDAVMALPWCYPMIEVQYASADQFMMLHNVDIRVQQQKDLAIKEVAVCTVRLGEPATVTATLKNNGYTTLQSPSLQGTVNCDGKAIALLNFTGATAELLSGATCSLTAQFTVSQSDYVGKQLTIKVQTTEADNDASNNSATTTATVQGVAGPIVSDLTGIENDAKTGVLLSWSNPITERVTDSFEFLTHGDYGAQLRQWSNIDFDGQQNYGIADVVFPSQGVAKAWQAIDGTQIASTYYSAHSGNSFLIAFSVEGGQSDDWLISEELKGDDGISFWLSAISSEFTETLEVLASTTDTDFDSFQLVQTIEKGSYGWEQYDIDLPAGTRYVALHYASNDQFGLMLDDVTYTPATPEYEFDSFCLYRNGEKIASDFTFTSLEDIHEGYRTNRYNVSVLAKKAGETREYPLGNTFSLAENGIAEINGTSKAAYYDLQGRRVLNPTNGVYVVRKGGRTSKVLVR